MANAAVSPASTPRRSGRIASIAGDGPPSPPPSRKRVRPQDLATPPSSRKRLHSRSCDADSPCRTPISSGKRTNGGPGTPTKVCGTIKSPRKRLLDVLDQKPEWNPRDPSHLNAVKSALHVSSVPGDATCREEQQEQVFQFCKDCIQQERSGSLYVSGSPGTGKSLVMEKVKFLAANWAKEDLDITEKFVNVLRAFSDLSNLNVFTKIAGLQLDLLSMNCTSMSDSSDVFNMILGKYAGKRKYATNGSPLKRLQSVLSQTKQSPIRKMMLLIVDEIDFLMTKDRSVLHELFMITTLPLSRCILIGVANAIDLADRLLPKLNSLNCKPLVITFRAYSKDQILKILQKRILVFPYVVFQSSALEICARKVSAASGDMRKALDSCRLAIEILEAENADSDTVIASLILERALANQAGPLPSDVQPSQKTNLVRIDHMVNALSKTFKFPVVNTIQSLPLHQQMILCSVVMNFRTKKNISETELYKSYSELARSKKVSPASILEFTSVSGLLAEQGLVKFGKSQKDKSKAMTLQVDATDVIFALQGNPLLNNCIQSDR